MKSIRWVQLCTVLTLMLAAVVIARAARDAGAKWTTSYSTALADAKNDKKVILAYFTCTDGNTYCAQLKKQVLDTDSFKTWSQANVELLELDYPKKKTQSDELKKQNQDLATQFQVSSVPVAIILNSDGKELGRVVGYPGAVNWASEVQSLVPKTAG